MFEQKKCLFITSVIFFIGFMMPLRGKSIFFFLYNFVFFLFDLMMKSNSTSIKRRKKIFFVRDHDCELSVNSRKTKTYLTTFANWNAIIYCGRKHCSEKLWLAVNFVFFSSSLLRLSPAFVWFDRINLLRWFFTA